MRKYLTVKRMVRDLNIDVDTAKKIRRVMDGTDDPCKVSKRCYNYVKQCYNEPPAYLQILYAIDELYETCGVEYVRHRKDTPYKSYGISFCNTGDTYAITIGYEHSKDRFVITSWGDWYETNVMPYE